MMQIVLEEITIREVVDGFIDNAEDGVVGYKGRLNIRPAYQREFVYKDAQRNEVIRTVMRGYPSANFPLNVMYWAKTDDISFELIDGQQRTISLCQYVNNQFSIEIDGIPQNFDNLSPEKKAYLLDYKLQVYVCSGNADEKLEWFSIINLAGEPLTQQELLNANYTGPWLTSAKRYFMKSNSAAYALGNRYLDIEANQSRGKGLETAISWISQGHVKQYMADNQNSENADDLWAHFRKIIDWIEDIFTDYSREMKGLNWGQLYDQYHMAEYNVSDVSRNQNNLLKDLYVINKKGIFEYILSGCNNTRLLNVRVFDESTKRSVYTRQTLQAKSKKTSNCPYCTLEDNENKLKIWELEDMDADHVTAWSKGGATKAENCQLLCITHNRVKGNR